MTAATPPQVDTPGPLRWARQKLFRTWWDGLITVVAGGLLGAFVVAFSIWVLTSAQWEIIRANLTNFMAGRFPRDELWRLSVAVLIGAFAAGLLVGIVVKGRALKADGRSLARDLLGRTWPFLLLVILLLGLAGTAGAVFLVIGVAGALLVGRAAGRRLPARLTRWGVVVVILSPFAIVFVITAFGGVAWSVWGGLLLTLFLAVGGILLSFPLGVLLALGRRSSLPAARWISVAYIELVRGVPLISLLFIGFLMLALFLPPGLARPSFVIRGMVVFILFTAAYVAEIVRGGLQSVPRGQEEAAMALGLSPTRVTFLVVLPQALRAVIPALVGQFIILFKDTSLVAIVGLFEVLGVAQVITQQEEFRGQGLLMETLLFAALIYWVGSYTMSRESQRLEKRLGVGER